MTPQPHALEEQVLVIPRAEFEKNEPFEGYAPLGDERQDLSRYLQGPPDQVARFMPRSEVEDDESCLQIIPYITLVCDESVFTFRRSQSTGDPRLRGRLCAGIGGHVNSEDDQDSPFLAFIQGARRELKEEVGLELEVNHFRASIAGLIYNSADAVGRVHLGVSIILNIHPNGAKRIVNDCEAGMHDPKWSPLDGFDTTDDLEGWAKIVLDHLIAENTRDGKWSTAAFRERVNMLAICAANLASSSAGFLMSDTKRGHEIAKAGVEESAGATQAMLAGLIYHGDISNHKLKKAGQQFQKDLGNILKHQSE